MFFRSRRFLVLCLLLTALVLSFPKIYYISQQSVLPRLWTLKNFTSKILFNNDNAEESLNSTSTSNPENVQVDLRPLTVILLAYHRTGSSLTGEILSLIPDAAYFFEPLYFDNQVLKNKSSEAHVALMQNVMDCDLKTLIQIQTRSSLHIIRLLQGRSIKVQERKWRMDLRSKCLKSSVKVFKTIRLSMKIAQTLLKTTVDHRIKIIHLVRDPRAMLSSVNQATIWREKDREPEIACTQLTQEIEMGNQLPKDVYLRIRYEDLVHQPKKTAEMMFEFLEVNVPDTDVDEYLNPHMQAENNPSVVKYSGEYFSTIRNSTFDINHWKYEVSEEFVQMVETYCEWFMETLGYERFAT